MLSELISTWQYSILFNITNEYLSNLEIIEFNNIFISFKYYLHNEEININLEMTFDYQ